MVTIPGAEKVDLNFTDLSDHDGNPFIGHGQKPQPGVFRSRSGVGKRSDLGLRVLVIPAEDQLELGEGAIRARFGGVAQ